MYKQRISRIQQNLISQQIDGLFITSPVDVFYLFGFLCEQYKITQPIKDPEAFLFITQTNAYILTDARNAQTAQQLAQNLNSQNENNENFAEFIPLPYPCDAKTLVKEIISQKLEKGSRIAFEESNISFSDLVQMKNFLKGYRTVDGSNMVTELRLTKDPEELKLLTKAAEITSAGFEFALQKLQESSVKIRTTKIGATKNDITEKEMAAEITGFFIKNADGVSFEPVVAFGEGSAIPHYKSTDKKIEGEGILLIDLGCVYKGYCGDMTRTVYIGKADEKFREIYKVVAQAQNAALKKLNGLGECTKTQKCASDAINEKGANKKVENIKNTKDFKITITRAMQGIGIDKVARDVVERAGFGQNFTHGLGHGIGLELHEDPYLKIYEKPLEDSMVFSVEPGIYIPGYGGVRIEDVVYLQNGKPVNITKTDKKLMELEL